MARVARLACAASVVGAVLAGCAARGAPPADGDAPRARCGPVCTLEVRNRLRVPIDVWAEAPSDPSSGGAPELLGRVEPLRTRSFRLRAGDARVRARPVGPGGRAAADFAAECLDTGTTRDGTRAVLCG